MLQFGAKYFEAAENIRIPCTFQLKRGGASLGYWVWLPIGEKGAKIESVSG